jgi:hypothetical protein
MNRSLPAILLLVAAAHPLACTSAAPSTGIVVDVTTDLAVPATLDQVRVTATATGGATLYDRSFPIATGAALPLRIGLTPDGDASAAFRVEAIGLHAGSRVVARSAAVSFVKGRIVLLHIPLDATCAGMTCAAAGATCIGGSCQPDAIDTSGLPTYQPGRDAGATTDAGADADAATTSDAAADAPATSDAPSDHATTIDAPADTATPTDAPADTATPTDAPADAPVDTATPSDGPAADGPRDTQADVPPNITTLNDGLVAYWSFDQAGPAFTDHSGNANTAMGPAPARSIAGQFGTALDLTAQQAAAGAPGSVSVNSIATRISIAAWVLQPPAGDVHTLVSRYLGLGYWKLGFADNGALRFTASASVIQTGSAASSGTQWTHVAATYDGQTARLYVGGALVTSGTIGAQSLAGGPTGQAGGYGPSIGATFMDVTAINIEYYSGVLDELVLYNRALTADEVSALARGVFPARR